MNMNHIYQFKGRERRGWGLLADGELAWTHHEKPPCEHNDVYGRVKYRDDGICVAYIMYSKYVSATMGIPDDASQIGETEQEQLIQSL